MLRFCLPGIESEHHEAQPLQVAKHLVGKQRKRVGILPVTATGFTEKSSIVVAAWFGPAPDTAAGSRSWRTGSSRSRPGWRAAAPGETPAGSPVQYRTQPPAPSDLYHPPPPHQTPQPLSPSTHTLHQVKSFLRLQELLAVSREAHRLPELPLQK